MKSRVFKIFAPVVTLTLIISLCVIVPVSAEPADNAEHFDVTITLTPTGWDTNEVYRYGNPIAVTLPVGSETGPDLEKNMPCTVKTRNPYESHGIVTGDFGPEIGSQTGIFNASYHIVDNFQTCKGTVNWTFVATFEGVGTATFKLNCTRIMLYWTNSNPTSENVTVDASGSIRMIDGTGIFENLKFNGTGYKETGAGTIFHFEGLGHMAPN